MKKIKIMLLILIILLSCVFLLFFLSIWFFQNKLMFFPSDNIMNRSLMSQRIEYESIAVEGQTGNTYHGWIHRDDGASKYLVYFGGNAQCSATAYSRFEEYDIWSYFNGYNFLMIDYSEFGLSEGEIGEESMFDMAQATYDYLLSQNVPPENIYVMGYSIGTGVAVYLSSIREVGGLVLFAPYDDGVSLFNDKLNIFHGPLEGLVRNKLQSKIYAQEVRVQPLIVASVDDKVIPIALSEKLAEYFMIPPFFESVDDIGHNDLLYDPVSMAYVREYLNQQV